jgi:hypothetical protein
MTRNNLRAFRIVSAIGGAVLIAALVVTVVASGGWPFIA